MSLINKMLQDLDARNAAPTDDALAAKQVRTVRPAADRHEWFWRILAALVLAAVGLVAWVAWQMQPRKLATDLAFSAAEEARRKAAAKASKPAPASKSVLAAAPEPAPQPAAPVETPQPVPVEVARPAPERAPPPGTAQSRTELFKLAQSIDTPIPERAAPRPAATATVAKAPPPAQLATAAPSEPASRLSKRERPRSESEEAEALFRHGVTLLKQRRTSEAQENFAAALARFPRHEAARQAQVSVLLERRQVEEARRLLEEGLALNTAQVQFATVLARIQVESGDYRGAAGILAPAANAARDDAEFQVLHGAVLQRLGRHAEAAEALQNATRISAQPGATWVALGVSYEALGRKPDAVQAYRRSLSAPIAQDVRSYAENRIRALD